MTRKLPDGFMIFLSHCEWNLLTLLIFQKISVRRIIQAIEVIILTFCRAGDNCVEQVEIEVYRTWQVPSKVSVEP